MEHNMCCRIFNKQKHSTIPSRKSNNCFWDSLYNSLPKYLRDMRRVKIEKLKFELNKFLEFILDESKMLKYDTAAKIISIVD